MKKRIGILLAACVLALAACAPSEEGSIPDTGPGDAGDDADGSDAPAGALVPLAPPVEVYTTRDATLGPVWAVALSGSAAVIWGERDPVTRDWGAPGFVVVDSAGTVTTPVVHLPDTGREPVGLVPQIELNRLGYFTLTPGAGCEVVVHRQSIDTLGRLLGAAVEVETLDDPVAVHVAALAGNAVIMAVEGNACTTARVEPETRMIVVGASGVMTGSVPLGPARRISAFATRPDGSGFLAMRDTTADGVLLDAVSAGGASAGRWAIAHREGTCPCPSATAVLAPGGTEYLAAWAGEIEGVQSWFLHVGPYFDEAEWGPPPDVIDLGAVFDRRIGAAVFESRYVLAYVPADGSAPFRVDLFDDAGGVEEGWSADVPGYVTNVDLAPLGHRVTVAWVEIWAGATAPTLLRVGMFERPPSS